MHLVHVKDQIQLANIFEASVQYFNENLKNVKQGSSKMGVLPVSGPKSQAQTRTSQRKRWNTELHNDGRSACSQTRRQACRLRENCRRPLLCAKPNGIFPEWIFRIEIDKNCNLDDWLLILLAEVLVEFCHSWFALIVEYKNSFDHSKPQLEIWESNRI